jgi:integrase
MTTQQPRQRRRGLTDKMLASWPRKTVRYIKADPELRGHYLRVPPEGPVVFAAVARSPYGKQIWAKIGTTAELKIEQARTLAREAIRRIGKGEPAFEPPKPKPESVASVIASWLQRHVHKNGLRTAAEIRRIADKYILPYWAERDFVTLRRSDIAALLDVLEDKHGAATADAALTVLRSVASWVQSRNDDYVPPFTKGMRRVQERERSRILTDDELRRVWHAATAADAGAFGAVVRLLLLTAQRRAKVASLRWDDISPDGTWTIRTEAREKGNADALQLPQVALDIIGAQPRFVGNPFVFATRSTTFSGRYKAAFDQACGITGWRLHDLRRTARSLMSRAGVLSEHAERVLGHVLGGVEGIYNRHSYAAEKADALRKLAALIERIVNPPAADNVVPLLHEVAS